MKKIVFDKGIVIKQGETVPQTILKKMSRAVPMLRTFPDMYSHVRIKSVLFYIDSGERVVFAEGVHTFKDEKELERWMQTSIIRNSSGNSMYNLELEVFNYIDEDIPQITKMNGMCSLFSAMVGRHNYKRTRYKTVLPEYYKNPFSDPPEMNATIPTLRNVLKAIVAHYMGTSISLYTMLDTNDATLWGYISRIFWVPKNYRKYEGEPVKQVLFLAGESRRCFDMNTINHAPFTAGSNLTMGSGPNPDPIIVSLVENHTIEVNSSNTFKDAAVLLERIGNRILSSVVVYPVEFTNGDGHTCRSFFIRPASIDTLYVDFVDQNKYSLVSIVESGLYTPMLHEVPFEAQDPVFNTSMLRIRNTIPREGNLFSRKYRSTNPRISPKVFFALRDKKTNRLGPLSKMNLTMLFAPHRLIKVRFSIQPS